METSVWRVIRLTAAGAVGSLAIFPGLLLGLLPIVGRLVTSYSEFITIFVLAVAVAAALVGWLLIYADGPARRGEGRRICRVVTGCGLLAGLATAFVIAVPAIGRGVVALTGCEAEEVWVVFGIYAVWLGAGVAAGLARRSWVAGAAAGVVAVAADYVGFEWISESLTRGMHGLEAVWVMAVVTGLLIGLGIGLVLALFKPRGGLKWAESVLTE